jgi:tetratricopeptide (TPR) repeat protein
MKKALLTIFLFLTGFYANAQSANDQLAQALKLKNEWKFPESYVIFQKLLKSDSNNVIYLFNVSFLSCKLGYRQKTEEQKQSYYKPAEYLAKKAITADNNSADAHYGYALALARINEFASSKQKIANAKLIKTECDKAIAINPNIGGVYHIMGRWNRTIAGFGSMERFMINSFFGGVPPGGTYEDAIKCFAKAIQLEPTYIRHQYEMAVTYYDRDKSGDMAQAKTWIERALKCPINCIDDENTKRECLELQKKME